jgi:hypothetical protein
LKTGPSDFSVLNFLICCWSGTKPPKPRDHGSLHKKEEGKCILINSWRERHFRIFSQNSGGQTNMECNNFSVSCLEKEWRDEKGQLYQGERQAEA